MAYHGQFYLLQQLKCCSKR